MAKRVLRSPALQKLLGPTSREVLRAWLPWIIVAGILLLIGWFFVKPAPPARVVIAAGPKDGAYYHFAKMYSQTFADNDVTLEVRETAGTVENYRLLQSGEVSLAIVQGGAAPQGMQVELGSVASLYLEPVWVFHRGDEADQIVNLRGRRIAIGAEGSGTRAIALRLLAANDIAEAAGAPPPPRAGTQPTSAPTQPATTLVPIGGRKAIDALAAGEIDAAFFVISPTSPLVQELLRKPGIRLMNVDRHEAYTRMFPYLSSVKLPRGVIDLDDNLPAQDVHLVAPAANLVIRDDLHPTLIPLVAKAASLAHERGDLLSRPGEFPSMHFIEFPIDPAAREYFRSGPPFLQRYLPFWVAALVDRMKILLLPLITLLIPLMRIGPPLYVWRIRSRIYRWYRVLRDLDYRSQQEAKDAKQSFDEEFEVLRALEAELRDEKVPLSYMEEFYNLRLHAEYIRRKLEERVRASPGEARVAATER